MELKKILYKTVHRRKKSVEEIADRVGCSSSLLYRCSNPNDSQARFPLEKVLPLMLTTGDYGILKHLASRSGFVLYKIPARIKYNKTGDLNKYQSIFADTFRALLDFKEGRISKEKCLSQMDGFLGKTVEIRRGIETNRQLNFEFYGPNE